MPSPRRWPSLPLRAAALALGLLAACGDEEASCPPQVVQSETACSTTADCIDEGFSSLRCVGGVCRLPCNSDGDCVLSASPMCVAEQGAPPDAVCEDKLCMPSCDATPCAAGLECHDGRCSVAFESFELREGETVGSFERYGWNALPTGPERLQNPTHRLVESGRAGCTLGDDDCAGPAASGTRFALVGRQPTSEKGSPTLGPTCRPCACCLECQVEPYAQSPLLDACPVNAFVPAPLECPASVPPSCAEVCAQCEQCPAAETGRGEAPSLVSCEATAAARACPSCPRCDGAACRSCRTGACSSACAADVDAEACRQCEAAQCPSCADCRACDVCSEAVSCAQVDPGAASCARKRRECDALGADGCYPTPLRYDRSELTPLEQALVSPEVDLSGRTGSLVLSFAYVPFGVGRTYFESRQGVPASRWERVTQEVVVELCGADCETPGAWTEGTLVRGGRAAFPPGDRRDNGLSVGKQSAVDWRSGRLEVVIPESLRTASFRYRFRPRLAPEARVGIDDIRVRTRP